MSTENESFKADFERGWIEVVVEIPKGSRNKYEIDHDSGEVWLDRHLFTATSYPADYGFVPDTLAEDGDPLDVLVLLEVPTLPGCHVRARPLAVFWMEDEAGPDAKILAVPFGDPRWDSLQNLDDVPSHLLSEISHFFEVYKALEPNKSTDVGRWGDLEEAWVAVADSKERAAAEH
jgi:inorganic pyrophosphatase